MEMGFDHELQEARKALEELMSRALKESGRRQKADEEVAASLQKVTPYLGSEVHNQFKTFSATDEKSSGLHYFCVLSEIDLNF
jgi:hypothetical protein